MSLSLAEIARAASNVALFRLSQQQAAQANEDRRLAALAAAREQERQDAQLTLQQGTAQLALDRFAYDKTQDIADRTLLADKDAADRARQAALDKEAKLKSDRDYMEGQRKPLIEATLQSMADERDRAREQADLRSQLSGDLTALATAAGSPIAPSLIEQLSVDDLRTKIGQLIPRVPEASMVGGKLSLSPYRAAQTENLLARTDLVPTQKLKMIAETLLVNARTETEKQTLQPALAALDALTQLRLSGAAENDARVQKLKYEVAHYMPGLLRLAEQRANAGDTANAIRLLLGQARIALGQDRLEQDVYEFANPQTAPAKVETPAKRAFLETAAQKRVTAGLPVTPEWLAEMSQAYDLMGAGGGAGPFVPTPPAPAPAPAAPAPGRRNF